MAFASTLRSPDMMLVPYLLKSSSIHGLGIFAERQIDVGECIWAHVDGFDRVIPLSAVAGLPACKQEWLRTYGYIPVDGDQVYRVDVDDGRFMNHAETANTEYRGHALYATEVIRPGEEITCHYREFAADWDAGMRR